VTGRTWLQIRRYGRSFAILLALAVIGTACGFYIVLRQRLPNPFLSFYPLNGAFASAAAVVPALGEPVNVAGVRVGEISGVSLKDGQGIVRMRIDPSKLRELYADAHADLVPNTPLKDMQINIWPGHSAAGVLAHGATIPVAQTTSPLDADEVLSALDTDTRTWLLSLITEFDQGTAGRGQDLRRLLQALGPTTTQLREVGDVLAERRAQLARLVHNFGALNHTVSENDAQLRTLVQAGDVSIQALASQDVALREAIGRLPGTLHTARKALVDLGGLAGVLGPTSRALIPSAHRLPTTLHDTQTLLQGAAVLPLSKIRPFVAAVLPLANTLPVLARDLRIEIPALLASFKVLAYSANEFAYNPGGRNPGFLYWFAWFAHNADSFISNSDANGPVWRTLFVSTCSQLRSLTAGLVLEQAAGTTFGCK
jgi:phospholipid/cholesterol/gamma-HCH transport system substrate-binding protein